MIRLQKITTGIGFIACYIAVGVMIDREAYVFSVAFAFLGILIEGANIRINKEHP